MDPNTLPAVPTASTQPKTDVKPTALAATVSPLVQKPMSPVVPANAGHPEAERPRISQPTEVKLAPVAESKPALENKAVVEAQANLKLAKEIMPGVHEMHTTDEPITLPSQIAEAGVNSMPLPLGAATYKRPELQLPMTQTQISGGLHQSVKKAARWLAEWCRKQIKEAHWITRRKVQR